MFALCFTGLHFRSRRKQARASALTAGLEARSWPIGSKNEYAPKLVMSAVVARCRLFPGQSPSPQRRFMTQAVWKRLRIAKLEKFANLKKIRTQWNQWLSQRRIMRIKSISRICGVFTQPGPKSAILLNHFKSKYIEPSRTRLYITNFREQLIYMVSKFVRIENG